MEFTVTATMLAACLPFAGKKDVRYYLNGVKIEQAAGSSLRAVATDGHAALACRDEAAHGKDVPDCILPREVVEWALKSKAAAIDIEIDENGDCLAVAGSASMTFRMIDGMFPDWRAVLPFMKDDAMPADVDFIATGLVARFDKALAKAGSRGGAAVRFVGGGQSRAVRVLVSNLTDGVHATGVVMPLRTLWNDGAEALA